MSAPRYPALAEWRRELAAGRRTAATCDALWRAACWEATAREFERIAPDLAESCRREAHRVVLDALRGAS